MPAVTIPWHTFLSIPWKSPHTLHGLSYRCAQSQEPMDHLDWGQSAGSRWTGAPAVCHCQHLWQHSSLGSRINYATMVNHLGNSESRAPLLLQDVKAYATLTVDIGMIYLQAEQKTRVKGICFRVKILARSQLTFVWNCTLGGLKG